MGKPITKEYLDSILSHPDREYRTNTFIEIFGEDYLMACNKMAVYQDKSFLLSETYEEEYGKEESSQKESNEAV